MNDKLSLPFGSFLFVIFFYLKEISNYCQTSTFPLHTSIQCIVSITLETHRRVCFTHPAVLKKPLTIKFLHN